MKQIVLSFLLFSIALTNAFAVKIDIENMDYHANCKGSVKSIKKIERKTITISYYNADGCFLRCDRLVDNEQHTISSMKYQSGKPIEFTEGETKTIIKYDRHNLFIEERDGKELSEKLLTPKNLDYRLLMFRSNGDYDVMGEYTYDKNDNVVEMRSYKYSRNGWRKTGIIKKEYSKNNVLETELWYDYWWDTIPKLKNKKFYNEDGNIKMELRCRPNGEAYDTTIFSYDVQGNLIHRSRINHEGKKEILSKTYKYDDHGNPTEIVSESKSDIDSWGNYSDTVKCEYEYYPQANTEKASYKEKIIGEGPAGKLEQEGCWDLAFQRLTKLAAKGDKHAQCRLAFYYKTGTATNANFRKAVELYKAAAEQGYAEAQHCLGECYLLGTGVEQNLDEACKWFEMAAENGYKRAYYDAGICLQTKERNAISDKAIAYIKKSAATGYQPGIVTMQAIEKSKKEKEKKAEEANRTSKPIKGETVVLGPSEEALGVATDEAKPAQRNTDDMIYTRVETKASYVGGNAAIRKYLKENMVYPQRGVDVDKQGNVILQFTVNKDGSVSDIEVLRSVDPVVDLEAVRLVKGMKNWNPAKIGNKPVRSKYRLIIPFKLEGE